jgi:hypothetical protein
MEILWPIKPMLKSYYGYGYRKMHRKRNKAHVAYKDKLGKTT